MCALYSKRMSFAPLSARRLLPDLLLLIVAIIWGGSYLATQDLAAASSAAAVMCARFVPAAVILVCVISLDQDSAPGFSLSRDPAWNSPRGDHRSGNDRRHAHERHERRTHHCPIHSFHPDTRIRAHQKTDALFLDRKHPACSPGITLLVGGQDFAGFNLGDGLMLVAAATRALLGVAEARFTVGRNADVLGLTTVEILFGAVIFAVWGGNSLLEHIPGFTVATGSQLLTCASAAPSSRFSGSSGQRDTPQLHAPECSSAQNPGGHSSWECSLAEIELERSDMWVPRCSSLQHGGVHVRNSAGAEVAWPRRRPPYLR